ncbi:replication protein A 32 kDa subunit [Eupeodes corollae]|uniref:replication protein A 32 kDa subunit n=1 Tax=Eupeodes corollae TaxID=290404 RepID=UPI002490CEA2|nr:replication protein A 32 kDa subunit [Eupeodes corollae]
MNDSFGGDTFNATQGGGAGAATEQKAEGVVPVVLKQVLESPEGNFQMWGMTFGMVTNVAIVRSIDTSSTKMTYHLEDHTGQIEAHYWLEEGDALKAPDIMLNNYAKVFGTVRQHGGQKTLMVFKMLPVTDANQVVTHLLEVLHSRFKAEEYSKKIDSAGGFGDFSMGGGAQPSAQSGGGNNLGLDSKQLAVFQAIKNHASEEGISRMDLQKKFNHMSRSELDNALDFMTSEGHIYSSIDADHFLSTDG